MKLILPLPILIFICSLSRAQIPSTGLQVWLKADAGITKDAGNLVSQWNDQSANGFIASQAVGGQQPLWVDNIVKGKPVLRFSGSQYLSSNYTGVSGSGLTFFVVAKGSNLQSMLRFQGAVGYTVYPWGNSQFILENDGSIFGLNAGFSSTQFKLGCARWKMNTINGMQTFSNGVLVGQRNSSNTGLNNESLYIGSYQGNVEFMDGDVAEIIIYNRAVTDAERAQVENYLADKYIAVDGGAIGGDQSLCDVGSPSVLTNNIDAFDDAPGVVYQWQSSINGGLSWSDIPGANSATYLPASVTQTIHYHRRATNVSLVTAFSNIVIVTQVAGDPSVIPDLAWNYYVYSGADLNLDPGNVTYRGFFQRTPQDINTTDEWQVSGAPSLAVDYKGCPVYNDGYTVVAKRKGFTTGNYVAVIYSHDDGMKLFKDGIQLYSATNAVNTNQFVPLGSLNSNSIIEIRLSNTSLAGSMQVVFTPPGLPVRLISFIAQKDNAKTRLQWKTADEVNNKGFFVMRSRDGQHYSSIGWVPAQISSAPEKSYSFIDEQPMMGTNYYQLKQTDIDGREELSPVKTVRFENDPVARLSPNPAHKMVTITEAANTTIFINDFSGRLIRQLKVTTQVTQINIEDLRSGYYLVTILDKKGNRQTLRFVKAD